MNELQQVRPGLLYKKQHFRNEFILSQEKAILAVLNMLLHYASVVIYPYHHHV